MILGRSIQTSLKQITLGRRIILRCFVDQGGLPELVETRKAVIITSWSKSSTLIRNQQNIKVRWVIYADSAVMKQSFL